MNKRIIAIFTTSRAEFGQLESLVHQIHKDEFLSHFLFVGGSHLAKEYGKTLTEIESSGVKVTDMFNYLLSGSDSNSLTKSSGIATYELARIFNRYDFDFVCVLGDRFELLSIITNAILFMKPIIHISGGEISEGSLDNQVRHMITKAAHIHITACKEYSENIRKMGEENWRVFNCGALAIDGIVKNKLIRKEILFEELNLDLSKETIILTYHPVTLDSNTAVEDQINNLFFALGKYNFQTVITAPNVDIERDEIYSMVKAKVNENNDYYFFDSLGSLRYHSLIPHSKFVIGNSSSGIAIVPFFKIPTVNIGERQKGRLRHSSIIDTAYNITSLSEGINKALSTEFSKSLKDMKFKFGDGYAAERIVQTIKEIKVDQKLLQKRLNFQRT